MLALTRRKQEAVIINLDGTLVKVVVAEVRNNGAVKLAFDAPANVSIDREEIYFAKLEGVRNG